MKKFGFSMMSISEDCLISLLGVNKEDFFDILKTKLPISPISIGNSPNKTYFFDDELSLNNFIFYSKKIRLNTKKSI